MAHELHSRGCEFVLHYSGRSCAQMGYLQDLSDVAWTDRVRLHISDENTRRDFAKN